MDRSVVVAQASAPLVKFASEHDVASGGQRELVVVDGERIVGLVSFGSLLHLVEKADPDLTLGQLVHRNYVLAREEDVMFDVITRMSRRGVRNVLVVGGEQRVPRASNVRGVVSKEHIADSVAESLTFRTARR